MAESGNLLEGLVPEVPLRRDDLVAVQVTAPIGNTLTYAVPSGVPKPPPGTMVQVPLGSRREVGVVWPESDLPEPPDTPNFRVRPLEAIFPHAPIPMRFLRWIEWASQYVMAQRGPLLDMAVRKGWLQATPPEQTVYRWNGQYPKRMTPARARLFELFAAQGSKAGEIALSAARLKSEPSISAAIINALAKSGYLIASKEIIEEGIAGNVGASGEVGAGGEVDAGGDAGAGGEVDAAKIGAAKIGGLSAQQAAVAGEVCELVAQQKFATYLIDGVTGSGKTEVYFAAIDQALRSGGQALVLVPEIILTTDLLSRFAARFGHDAMAWHARVSSSQKSQIWRKAQRGNAGVIIGARSALFLPFANLRLIVVDEEHDSSYKQDDGVSYHARDLAVARAKHENATVVLASATPSLETLRNVERGRYQVGRLDSRFGKATTPDVSLIDLRQQPPERGKWIGAELSAAISENLASGKQTLLFLTGGVTHRW